MEILDPIGSFYISNNFIFLEESFHFSKVFFYAMTVLNSRFDKVQFH